jgi:hypothetical protein
MFSEEKPSTRGMTAMKFNQDSNFHGTSRSGSILKRTIIEMT